MGHMEIKTFGNICVKSLKEFVCLHFLFVCMLLFVMNPLFMSSIHGSIIVQHKKWSQWVSMIFSTGLMKQDWMKLIPMTSNDPLNITIRRACSWKVKLEKIVEVERFMLERSILSWKKHFLVGKNYFGFSNFKRLFPT